MARHGDRVKAKDVTKKELHVLKQQLRKNMKLCRQTHELQQDQEQQWAQCALTDETAPGQVKDASQQLTRSRNGE